MVTNFSIHNESILDEFSKYPPERINISPFAILMEKVTEYHNDNDPNFTTIEPEKMPMDKEKSRAFGSAHPI